MDWTEIVTAVIAGGTLGRLIDTIAGRKKIAAEAEQIAEATARAAAAEWRQLSDVREAQVKELEELIASLEATIDVMARQMETVGAGNGLSRAILEQMPDYLYLHDLDGRITYATPAAAALLGGTPETVIGKTAEERGDRQEGVASFHEFRQLVVLSGKAQMGEVTYRSGGRLLRMAFNISPFRRGGQVAGTIAVSRDITHEYTPRY